MKYWGIAIKTEETFMQITQSNKYLVPLVFYAGIALIILTFSVQGLMIDREKKFNTPALEDVADVLVLLIQVLALGFLIDAFRRFMKISSLS